MTAVQLAERHDLVNGADKLRFPEGQKLANDMTAATARSVGGFGAFALGIVGLDVFPPFGLVETGAAVAVLLTHRAGPSLATLIPTCLILWSAVRVMVDVSGPGNPVMWPIVVAAILIAITLIRGRTVPTSGRKSVLEN